MYESKTVEGIKRDILSRVEGVLQTREGGFTNDVISAAALEIHNLYHSLDALIPAFYLDETSGAYIDKQAAMFGIIRKAGTPASCSISFTGAPGATVPAGTAFFTASGLEFTLEEEAVIGADGSAEGTLTASAVGESGNIGQGEIVSTIRNYSGITGHANQAAAGGTDSETDASLLGRLWDLLRRPPTSGNHYHYQQWAKSVDGVGAARAISKWNGAGTVKVVLASQDMEPVDGAVVAAAQAYMDSQRPVGAEVTAVSAASHALSINAAVTISATTSLTAVKDAFQTAVQAYLLDLTKASFEENVDLDFEALENKSYIVRYNQIVYLLLSTPGVLDFTTLTLNGGTSNVSIAADAVPLLEEVAVS